MPAVIPQRFDELINGHNDREIPSLETYPRVRIGWGPDVILASHMAGAIPYEVYTQPEPVDPATWVNGAIHSNHIADALAYSVSSAIPCPANIPVSLSTTTQTSTSGREWVVSTEVKVENYAQLLRQLADEIDLGHVKVAYGRFYDNGGERVLNITLEKQEWTSAK